MGKHIHFLSNKDLVNMTADCRNCGPVRIVNGSCHVVKYERQKARDQAGMDNGKGYFVQDPEGGDPVRIGRKQGPAFRALVGLCELCGASGPLVIDHCHTDQYVRGVLCMGCNSAIGRLGDNLEGLMRAVEYMQEGKRADLYELAKTVAHT